MTRASLIEESILININFTGQELGNSPSDLLWRRPFFNLSGGTFLVATVTVSLISTRARIRISDQLLFYLPMRKRAAAHQRRCFQAASSSNPKRRRRDAARTESAFTGGLCKMAGRSARVGLCQ